MLGQCLFNIRLAESDTGLTEKLRIGPDDGNFAGRQTGQNQRVESVILQIVGPERLKGGMEIHPHGSQINGRTITGGETKIMDHHHVALCRAHRCGLFVDDVQTHIFQHRHDNR